MPQRNIADPGWRETELRHQRGGTKPVVGWAGARCAASAASGFDPLVSVRFRHSSHGEHYWRGGLDSVKDAKLAPAKPVLRILDRIGSLATPAAKRRTESCDFPRRPEISSPNIYSERTLSRFPYE